MLAGAHVAGPVLMCVCVCVCQIARLTDLVAELDEQVRSSVASEADHV